jgi:hypothetical protein
MTIKDYSEKVIKYLADPTNRLFLYQEYLKYIKNPETTNDLWICNNLCNLIEEWGPKHTDFYIMISYERKKYDVGLYTVNLSLKEAFPEIVKPKNAMRKGSTWFPNENKENRIMVIEKAIKKLKTKYNVE